MVYQELLILFMINIQIKNNNGIYQDQLHLIIIEIQVNYYKVKHKNIRNKLLNFGRNIYRMLYDDSLIVIFKQISFMLYLFYHFLLYTIYL